MILIKQQFSLIFIIVRPMFFLLPFVDAVQLKREEEILQVDYYLVWERNLDYRREGNEESSSF